MATTAVTAIVDEKLNREATAVLAEIGMTVEQAFELLLTQVVEEHRLPIAIHVPNAETIAAIHELERGEGKRYATSNEMFADLDL